VAVYAVGDVQGCFEALQALLTEIRFDPSRDRLWFTGDLVNRGPQSTEVLRFVRDLGERAVVVLGNHDIHLLAIWTGYASLGAHDSLRPVLRAPDGDELLHWLRNRPFLHHEPDLGFVLAHAGIPPQWDLAQAKACASQVEAALRGENFLGYFAHLYGDEPSLWSERLHGWERLRYITNAFTRMRYCDENGRLLLDYKGSPDEAPTGYIPWFQIPWRRYDARLGTVICGHWSTLGYKDEPGLLAIDTGCLWGGELTAVRLDGARRRFSLRCKAAAEHD